MSGASAAQGGGGETAIAHQQFLLYYYSISQKIDSRDKNTQVFLSVLISNGLLSLLALFSMLLCIYMHIYHNLYLNTVFNYV